VPQVVPFVISVVESTHCEVPVAHEVVPATHLFGFVEQARPAVQAVHVPLSQTAGTVGVAAMTQLVPFAMFVAVFTHC
jgi:hypothetical protein